MRVSFEVEGIKVSYDDGNDDVPVLKYPDYAARATTIIRELGTQATNIALAARTGERK